MPPQHPATPPQAAPLHRLSRPLYAGDPGNSVCADQAEDSVLVARASLVVTSLPRLWSSRPSLPSGRHVPDKTPSSASFQCLALLWLSRPPSRQAAGRGGAAAGAGGPARRRRARQDAAARVRPRPARRSRGARTGGELSLTSQESFRPQLLVYGPKTLQKCLQWGSERWPRTRVLGLVSGSFH